MKKILIILALTFIPIVSYAAPITCDIKTTYKIWYGANAIFEWKSTGALGGFVFAYPAKVGEKLPMIDSVTVAKGTSGMISRAYRTATYFFVFFNGTEAKICSSTVTKLDI